MSKKSVYLIVGAIVVLASVAGYFWWKGSGTSTEKVIASIDVYRRSDDVKVGSVWVEDDDVVYDLDESAEDMISYIESNKLDWLENGVSYDIGECDKGICWDGEKTTTIKEDDFINGVYTILFDEFLEVYFVDAIEE